jgi:hypothetical protein
MIYCIWYPSGGFGHFINAVLSLHGNNFARPQQQQVTFGADGNSHALELTAPKYSKDPVDYLFDFDTNVNYSVLIDNGIDNETRRFRTVFPNAQVFKLCYTDTSWPIVAKTSIVKALGTDISQELTLGQDWPDNNTWARREKYFLFLRDHNFRHSWRAEPDCYNLLIESFFNYNLLKGQLTGAGVVLSDFEELHQTWLGNNYEYINPVLESLDIIDAVKNRTARSLTHITDVWDQAVVYYFLWLSFAQEVPHNDYKDFFANTTEIADWLQL